MLSREAWSQGGAHPGTVRSARGMRCERHWRRAAFTLMRLFYRRSPHLGVADPLVVLRSACDAACQLERGRRMLSESQVVDQGVTVTSLLSQTLDCPPVRGLHEPDRHAGFASRWMPRPFSEAGDAASVRCSWPIVAETGRAPW